MKFKVGDKVRILDGSKIEHYTCGWASGMKNYVGKITTIRSVFNGRCVLNGCNGYVWDERGLELVTNEQIIIYRKENEVIALNKATGEKGVAKYSPEDKFDFNIGAKLALDRLISEDEVEEAEEPKFKVGDIVEKTTPSCGIPVGTRGIVAEVRKYDCLIDFRFEYNLTHRGEGNILPNETGLYLRHESIRKVSK